MSMVGLFFGSFNPIHNGHLTIARYLLKYRYCEEVWFVVSPQNPWKKDQTLLEEEKRLQIVQSAIAEDSRMKASDVEFYMPRPSYTSQTLQLLKRRFPETGFSLIIGGDNLQRFHYWQNYEEILKDFPLFVYPRRGYPIPKLDAGHIVLINAPLSDISSTAIREKIEKNEDISTYVPASALALIQEYYGSR